MHYRLLRCSEHTARGQYYCTACEHPIFPGDRYEYIVRLHVGPKHRSLVILREHLSPFCPFEHYADLDDCVHEAQLPLDLPLAA